jgi:GNAT superfamily N-acetyltransferase
MFTLEPDAASGAAVTTVRRTFEKAAPERAARAARTRSVQTEAPLRFAPLTPERWPDLETLFGANGACGGCWCMWWRQSHGEFKARKGATNKRLFRKLVESGSEPGILAYAGQEAVGWCAVAPRAEYRRLETSRNLKPVDDAPAWATPCFFVARQYRRQGLTVRLLHAAIERARRAGAPVLEGYPIEPGTGNVPAAFAWTGFVPAFFAAGFKEALRRSQRQPIMRIDLATRLRKPRVRPISKGIIRFGLVLCAVVLLHSQALLGQSIDIVSSSDCASCDLDLPRGGVASVFVRVRPAWLNGLVLAGQFRITGLPSDWLATYLPAAAAHASVGDPLGAGVTTAFPSRQLGECIDFGTVVIEATSMRSNVRLQIEQHVMAPQPCPIISYDTFADPPFVCAAGGTLLINSDVGCPIGVNAAAWSAVKLLFK